MERRRGRAGGGEGGRDAAKSDVLPSQQEPTARDTGHGTRVPVYRCFRREAMPSRPPYDALMGPSPSRVPPKFRRSWALAKALGRGSLSTRAPSLSLVALGPEIQGRRRRCGISGPAHRLACWLASLTAGLSQDPACRATQARGVSASPTRLTPAVGTPFPRVAPSARTLGRLARPPRGEVIRTALLAVSAPSTGPWSRVKMKRQALHGRAASQARVGLPAQRVGAPQTAGFPRGSGDVSQTLGGSGCLWPTIQG